MLATELLFVYIYCLVDDASKAGVLLIPCRPGPAPACTDAELLSIALVRHLLGRRSENGFLDEIRASPVHAFLDGYHTGLLVTIALMAAGVVVSYLTLRPRPGVSSEPMAPITAATELEAIGDTRI